MRDYDRDNLLDRIFTERRTKTDESFENLANAIILQAVHDYRQVLKAADRESRREECRIERFFRSR